MISPVLAVLAALSTAPQSGEVIDEALYHNWRIVMERPDVSVAVMADPVEAGTNGKRDVWMFATFAEPRALRPEAEPVRQLVMLGAVDCAAQTAAIISTSPAVPAEPPRTYRAPEPRDYGPNDPPPPVPIMPGPPPPLEPIRPGTALAAAASVVCGGDADAFPVVEGDWAAVLNGLLARSDARKTQRG